MRVETIVAAGLIGFVLLVVDNDLGRGIASFFIGGIASRLVDAISPRKVSRKTTASLDLDYNSRSILPGFSKRCLAPMGI